MRRFGKKFQSPSFSMSAFMKPVNYEIFRSIKSYLVKLQMGIVQTESFILEEIFSYSEPGIFTLPSIVGFDVFDNVMFGNSALLGVVRFREERYFISCASFDDRGGKVYALFISGEITGDFRPQELSEILLKEAVLNSGYSGKILRIFYDDYSQRVSFKILPSPEISLNDIYMKDKTELEDFISAVKDAKQGLRYLFVGEPGTGKTDTIRALISECKEVNEGLTVFVLDAGCGLSLETLFDYAEIFRPVLVCIDDIDLIVGSREGIHRREELSTALQALDGFITKEDTFLIATTNDRYLVDNALRRPGRFDLIIEFESLASDFYYPLVLREIGDESLAQIFKNGEVMKKLSNLKVTGAFIVTLVKYLGRERFREIKYEIETVIKVIDRLYGAFKKEVKTKELMGF
ncbi:ATP-binding protein [Thermodesulfovibrio yellowstonii]|uniref:ATP-binding protein n=1 Tax=Thermodesulfovibrio yellowstonii TaxID=28262 RepID=UPI003C7DE00C